MQFAERLSQVTEQTSIKFGQRGAGQAPAKDIAGIMCAQINARECNEKCNGKKEPPAAWIASLEQCSSGKGRRTVARREGIAARFAPDNNGAND